MNFELTEDQIMMRETFARFLDEKSSTLKVRAAAEGNGFDAELWAGLAELGAFCIRVPEESEGLGLGTLDACVLMEEAGRTLASGPIAETLVTTRLLAVLGGQEALLGEAMMGESIVSLAFHDLNDKPTQWISGGVVAPYVIAKKGDDIVLVSVPEDARPFEENLSPSPIAEVALSTLEQTVLGSGADAVKAFTQAVEEWKLLMAMSLAGISRESLRIAAEYASERKAFGQFIGTFQGVSHPLADLLVEADAGKLLVYKALRDIADNSDEAAATISITAWWNADVAARTVAKALHTFGGYGLTTEYDIHLYNLRAKSLPLVWGDPQDWIAEAGRRLYAGETTALPDVGDVIIDFEIGEEAEAMIAEIDAFMEKNMTPEIQENAHYSWEGHNPAFHKALADAKLLFLGAPKEMGGRGAPIYVRNAAMESFEKWNWKNPVANVAELVATMIFRAGSPELKEEVLTKIMSGDAICSLGYSEPGCGSDVFAAQCKATQLEDGSWRIDGTKMWTSGANLTDYVIMLTRTDPNVPKHKGLTMFIVPLKAEGVTVQAVHTFQDERTNITFYDGVIVPDSWRLGEINGGVRTMAIALELEHGGGFAKVQRPMLAAGVELAKEIDRGGHKLIEEEQAQVRLAKVAANVMVADLLTYRSLWMSEHKMPNVAQGPATKMYTSECFQKDSRDLMDLTAPHSLSKREGPAGELNLAYRHAQGTTIYGGTSEIHRSMVAERGLGLPRTRA